MTAQLSEGDAEQRLKDATIIQFNQTVIMVDKHELCKTSTVRWGHEDYEGDLIVCAVIYTYEDYPIVPHRGHALGGAGRGRLEAIRSDRGEYIAISPISGSAERTRCIEVELSAAVNGHLAHHESKAAPCLRLVVRVLQTFLLGYR